MTANIPLNATFNEVLDCVKNNIYSNLNCHNIGKIIAFNSTNCTATIEIQQMKEWNGLHFQPNVIPDVPIVTFGTQTSRITMPNPVGCNCVLLFMDRNIDNFMETGVSQIPNTDRMHSMTDCVALLTINSDIDTMPMYDENALTLSNDKSYIKLQPQKITVANDTQNLASLMQELLVACEGIICGSYSLTSASKKKFTDLKTKFEELLQ